MTKERQDRQQPVVGADAQNKTQRRRLRQEAVTVATGLEQRLAQPEEWDEGKQHRKKENGRQPRPSDDERMRREKDDAEEGRAGMGGARKRPLMKSRALEPLDIAEGSAMGSVRDTWQQLQDDGIGDETQTPRAKGTNG